MEQFNTIPTSGNWADIAGILDANFLRCWTALVQSQSLIGLDGSNYKGMYTSASALPDDMTEAGWALVGSSLSALQLYVFNDGATDWALFSNETYNFTSWTEFQTQLDALSTQVATIGLKIGDLANLTTTAKANIVAAINEVKQATEGISSSAEDTSYVDNYGIGADNVQDAVDKVGFVGTDTEIDLSQYTEQRAYISPDAKWITSNNTYKYYGKFIPVTPGSKYRITSNNAAGTFYAYLTSNVVGASNSTVTTFAGGATTTTRVGTGAFSVSTAPADAAYMWFWTGTDAGLEDKKPQKIEVVRKSTADKLAEIEVDMEGIHTDVDALQNAVDGADAFPMEGSTKMVLSGGVYDQLNFGDANEDIDLTQYTPVRAYPNPTKWICTNDNYPYYGMFIPVHGGDVYIISAQDTKSVTYAFLRNGSYSENANVEYATGSTRTLIPSKSSEKVVAPSNAMYLYVATYTTVDIIPKGIKKINKKSVIDMVTSIDDAPTVGSDSLVKSGGVLEQLLVSTDVTGTVGRWVQSGDQTKYYFTASSADGLNGTFHYADTGSGATSRGFLDLTSLKNGHLYRFKCNFSSTALTPNTFGALLASNSGWSAANDIKDINGENPLARRTNVDFIFEKTSAFNGFAITPNSAYGEYPVDITISNVSIAEVGFVKDVAKTIQQSVDLTFEEKIVRNAAIGNDGTTSPVLSLLHFSDIHGDAVAAASIRQFYDKYSTYIDDMLSTGDVPYYFYSDGIDFYRNAGLTDALLALGNHDGAVGSNWDGAGAQTEYETYFAPYISGWNVTQPTDAATNYLMYYYKDYTSASMRLIVIDVMHQDAAQLQWFTDTLADAKTNGYAVVVASHYIPDKFEEGDRMKKADGEVVSFHYYPAEERNSIDSRFYLDTVYAAAVEAFIADGGEFVIWLCGHYHTDYLTYCKDYPNVLFLAINQAGYRRGGGACERKIGDHCANLISIQKETGKIKLYRVGYRRDRIMRLINVLCYDYINKKVITDN